MSRLKGKFDECMAEIKKEDVLALDKLGDLERAWDELRFEGKASWGSNLKRLCEAYRFFAKDFVSHLDEEEEVIFPFIKRHVPRVEYTVIALCSDHEDFRRDIKILGSKLDLLKKLEHNSGKSNLLEKMNETMIFLIHLLRHHIQMEKVGIFKVIQEELTEEEKEKLVKLFAERRLEG